MSTIPGMAAGAAEAAAATNTREFLAFMLDKEEYGIHILKGQELRGYEKPTRIANEPDFIKGLVNLGGIVATIVDMRIKFNLSAPSYNQFTEMIILNVAGRTIGRWSTSTS